MPPSVSSHHCQLSPGGRISSGGTLYSEAPDGTACAFITSASPHLSCVGLKWYLSVAWLPKWLTSGSFFLRYSPHLTHLARGDLEQTPVWRWFHKAALDRGNGNLRAPEVMSPRSRSRLGPALHRWGRDHGEVGTLLGTGPRRPPLLRGGFREAGAGDSSAPVQAGRESPVIVALAGVGKPSPSSPSPLRPRELALSPGLQEP